MRVTVVNTEPDLDSGELIVLPYAGVSSALLERFDRLTEGQVSSLRATASEKPGETTVVDLHLAGIRAEAQRTAWLALVGVGQRSLIDEDSIRTAAAAAARLGQRLGKSVSWTFDPELPIEASRQARAVVEGAIIGGHDKGRWKTRERPAPLELLNLANAPTGLEQETTRAEVVARWTNHARDLVDGPPNEVTPAGLASSATELLSPVGVQVEILGPDEIEQLGLGGLVAVGRGSRQSPRLIVLRTGAGTPSLALIGKSITFDSGGLFLKPQSDIVKQKADMGGGAAVLGAVGAIAELGLNLPVLAVLPAAENMIDGDSFRPGDVIRTASGLTVEITNPDAEGRVVMADALWYARQHGATTLIDVATLTGAVRAALGDMYCGVFSNDEAWRDEIVSAGNDVGDYAWPLPLHPRYRPLLDSQIADLRNTAGRSFGYPILAATFLQCFVGDARWAHLDIHSSAFLDDERDYFTRGATGAGVRLLVEVAARLAAAEG